MKLHLGRITLRVAAKVASLAILLAVPGLAIMAFGPGLMQAWASDNVQVSGAAIHNVDAASTPAAKAKAAAQNHVLVLTAWEETCATETCGNQICGNHGYCGTQSSECETQSRECGTQSKGCSTQSRGCGTQSSCESYVQLANDVANAQSQALAAQTFVRTALLLSESGQCKAALCDLRIAAQDEQAAASSPVCAAQLAIGLNPTLANKPGGLVSLAIQLQTLATTLNLETATAQYTCPLSCYIQNTILPTAQQGVCTTNQAFNQVSGYKTSCSCTCR